MDKEQYKWQEHYQAFQLRPNIIFRAFVFLVQWPKAHNSKIKTHVGTGDSDPSPTPDSHTQNPSRHSPHCTQCIYQTPCVGCPHVSMGDSTPPPQNPTQTHPKPFLEPPYTIPNVFAKTPALVARMSVWVIAICSPHLAAGPINNFSSSTVCLKPGCWYSPPRKLTVCLSLTWKSVHQLID